MITHDKFIFLHLQKCGGTFVSRFLESNIPGSTWIHHGTHEPITSKPEGKFLFGVVRNPFDWYVSWYTKGRHVHGHISNGNTFPEFMRLLYRQKGVLHDINIDKCNSGNIGAYTFRHNHTFNIYPDFLCKLESLRDDIVKCFEQYNLPLNNEQLKTLYDMDKQNTSDRTHYRDYYDKETIKIVSERDKTIIEKYNYTF